MNSDFLALSFDSIPLTDSSFDDSLTPDATSPNYLQTVNLSFSFTDILKSSLLQIKQRQISEEQKPKSSKPPKSPKMPKLAKLPRTTLSKRRSVNQTLEIRGENSTKKVKLDKVSHHNAYKANPEVYDEFSNPFDNNKFDIIFKSTPFNQEIEPIKLEDVQKSISMKENIATADSPSLKVHHLQQFNSLQSIFDRQQFTLGEREGLSYKSPISTMGLPWFENDFSSVRLNMNSHGFQYWPRSGVDT